MTRARMARGAILLDRDGTLIEERNYLADPDGVTLLSQAIAGLQRLQRIGLPLVVVTNQSGIGRGLFSLEQMQAVHDRLVELLREGGITLAGIYACPHSPEQNCRCRKPLPGLVEQAAQELTFDPAMSFVVGDKPSDLELGRRVGAKSILVRTGYGVRHEAEAAAMHADAVADDLLAAARWIESQVESNTPHD